jgi:hypothetical protein
MPVVCVDKIAVVGIALGIFAPFLRGASLSID